MDRESETLSTPPSTRRSLATIAAVLAALAALAGDPQTSTERISRDADIAGLASDIALGKDHVTALELAEWIHDQRAGLRVIDVRSAEELDTGHIPTAESIDLAALALTPFAANDTIVLYSTEGVHAGQAWVLLRAVGRRAVFFLRGGWSAWLDEVMHPTLEEGASTEARAAFARAAALSRYFGGVPRIAPRIENDSAEPPTPPTPRHRRGC